MTNYIPTPSSHPELFDQILMRRIFASLIDFFIVIFFTMIAVFIVFFAGIFTLGLSWALIPLSYPITIIAYYGYFLGSDKNATLGMQFCDIILTQTGEKPINTWRGVAHMILRHISIMFLSPFILVTGIFTRRRQLLHDFAVDGLMVRRSAL